ncbi:MAG: phosphotransferase [Verrucomicrobiales bacterium]|nr:phosphotransferase [Verrucomicrobiales bacterium]
MVLDPKFEFAILEATGASSLTLQSVIQELWSGYGQIIRVALVGSERSSVVIKHVSMPVEKNHPRGWASDRSHQRKVFSYQVETEWYRHWSQRCDQACRIPDLLAYSHHDDAVLLILEDLDVAGYPIRLNRVNSKQMLICLKWLAEFHATFMGSESKGLWDTGTYWHLATRPEELEALEDEALKSAAIAIDDKLSQADYQTLVHGDAKLANFCFSNDTTQVAALDFQYVGRGCGMKDVAYFIGSCLDEEGCERKEAELLGSYFAFLKIALEQRQPDLDAEAVIHEWRELFPIAWTDFHRFLKGWCPGHWKIHSYSERLARQVIHSLK